MAQQMAMQGGGAMGGPGAKQPNMNQLFKEEWEALQVLQHVDALDRIEAELLHINEPLPLTDPQMKKRN